MEIQKYKTFDGKRYQLVSSFGKKSDAKRDAERRRKLDFSIRTVKNKTKKYYRYYNYSRKS